MSVAKNYLYRFAIASIDTTLILLPIPAQPNAS